jgi:cytochrome c peroxidase
MRSISYLATVCSVALVSLVQAEPFDTLEALGEALFFDQNLSFNRTQSCATCHDPDLGFADPRGAASIGDDGQSRGDRNAPTASYAAFVPYFHQTDEGTWVGGQFWDGRAPDLMEQAGGPPLNPVEMGMPDKGAVVERLLENPDYVRGFETLFETGILNDPVKAYGAMTQAIASFERTDQFAPFDSKYDRFLRGEIELSREEELGRVLFFSQQFTNCNLCHQLGTSQIDPHETFSSYEYHNIGVPVNHGLRAENGVGEGYVEGGLFDNPLVSDAAQRGKFRVPTLRNVAVTGPYMHNGVFEDLRTVVAFYNRYQSRSEVWQTNPETGPGWGPAEYMPTLSAKELTHGPVLDDTRIDALVAFLKTLTDQRYEHLLE